MAQPQRLGLPDLELKAFRFMSFKSDWGKTINIFFSPPSSLEYLYVLTVMLTK